MKISVNDVCYIGDDINDLGIFDIVGYSACPNDSMDYIKTKCNKVLNKKGGEGVFREFVEHILKSNEMLEKTLDLYVNSIE